MRVAVERLSFGYRRGDPIIDGLDYVFSPGVVTGVTGPSGRGKSTLLYLIGLLLTPSSGRIEFGPGLAASQLGDLDRSRLRACCVGFVFQDAMLDPSRSVLDNVVEGAIYAGLSRTTALQRAGELMERFGVALRANHKPGEVSGGQAQRVALCRALLTQPNIVLADEPTGNLDPQSAAVVVEALRESARREDATVIIASHDPRVTAACDQVLAL